MLYKYISLWWCIGDDIDAVWGNIKTFIFLLIQQGCQLVFPYPTGIVIPNYIFRMAKTSHGGCVIIMWHIWQPHSVHGGKQYLHYYGTPCQNNSSGMSQNIWKLHSVLILRLQNGTSHRCCKPRRSNSNQRILYSS